jgi:hypothetical protein
MEESMTNDVPISYLEEDVDGDARFTGESREILLERELTTAGDLFQDVDG